MSVYLPLAVGETSTNDASTVTVVEYSIPLTGGGLFRFDLVGEKTGDPTYVYSWKEYAYVNNTAGVTAIQAESTPEEIDPIPVSATVVLDVLGWNVRIRVTGFAGENWRWAGSIR
jgi:hypothetical protein